MTKALEKLARLVKRISAKTDNDELVWEELRGTYKTTIGESTVRILVEYSEFDPDADPDFYVVLYADGEEVDRVSDTELRDAIPNSFFLMRSLFANARRSARGVEGIADQLNSALDD